MLEQTVVVDNFYHLMTHSSYFCYHKPQLSQLVMITYLPVNKKSS